ncbi:MAG: flavin-dependent dehydrogenase [Alteromonadaceae bacterium]|jgi:flavin-dependent dehydrogenase
MNHQTTLKAHYDIVIIGAGWAGLALARQLKTANPELAIIQLEANTEFKAKVGEATVEIAGHYFIHHLGLVNYIYRNQLPKNGLRFFYDSEQHDLPLHEMSEHGTVNIPPHPAFQLDRAKLERDLVDMNREQGIDILMGAKVRDFTLDGDSVHQVSFNYQGDTQTLQGRWLIDASGKASLLAKKERLHNRNDVPKHFSAWGRFSNIADIDAIGPKEWRDRVNGRFLSTNHFAGTGYWIWVIPLSGGYTSIGVVGDKNQIDKPPLKQEQFLALLAEHKGLSELMVDAQLEDFEAWGQLAYRGERYISEKRWATTGFAAMFIDPLFSGGGDFIAILNDAITQTITADMATDDNQMADKQLSEVVPILNQQAHEYYQNFYAFVFNVYPIIDSGELCSPIVAYSTSTYFLESAWDYMAGNFMDLKFWQKKAHIRRGHLALEKILYHQTVAAGEAMREQGRYFDRNHEGFFESGAELYQYFVYDMGKKGSDGRRIDLRIKLWVDIFLKVTGSKLNLPDFASRRAVQECLKLPQIFASPLFDEPDLPPLLAQLGQFVTDELQQKTDHTVLVEVTRESFTSGMVNLQIVDGKDDADGEMAADMDKEAELKKLAKQADMIFNAKQEYIAAPFMVPFFLQFCRNVSDEIMSQPVLNKLEVEAV